MEIKMNKRIIKKEKDRIQIGRRRQMLLDKAEQDYQEELKENPKAIKRYVRPFINKRQAEEIRRNTPVYCLKVKNKKEVSVKSQ